MKFEDKSSDKESTDGDHEEKGGGGSLLRAARSGNLEKLINLLDQENVDISTANSSGLTALHLAAKEGHNDVIIELLSRSADINQQTKRGNTALHIASLAGKLPVVQLLLEKGADPNSQAQNAFTPLYMAAQEGHEDIVDYLLKHGANQSISTEDGFTPLAVALQESKDKVVALLLDNDVKGKVKLPALHIASRKDDVKAAALLLQNDNTADTAFNMMVNRTTESGFTALHIAAHYGNVNVGTLLLNRGAIVDFQAKNGITPMHVAAKRGHTRFCSLLIDRNGRPDARTRDGLMPLHCAARFGHLPIVKLFLDNQNIPRFAKTKNGLSALHMTTQAGHTDVIELLLSRDFPVDDTTADYLSALHIATHCGHVEAATLLLKHGARFNCKALNGFTPLHVACKKNRIKMVELLLSYHADREAVTESGLTPLHIACFMGHFEIVELLIQKKSNLNSVNVRGETALHMATRSGQTEIVSYLLRHGAKPDTRKQESQTCLHLAARLDKLEILKILLKYGATLDAEMEDGYTPLHVGCKEGHVQVCEVLLDKGASVALTTKKGFTPLHLAAKYGRLEVTNLLLKNHSSPDACGKDGLTSLHVAAHFDNQQVALLLLKNGASPHASGKNGYTPLHIAAKKNQMEIALTLLEYGASPNCKTRMDVTPLHLASQEGHTDMCSILLAKDANVNTGAKFGLTPMHLAAQEDRISVAKVLYDNGSLVDPLTKAGCTPLHVASHHGNIKVANYLLSLGAKVNAKTKNGYTPLHQASQQGHTHVVNLLLQYGASPNELTNSGNTALSLAKRLGYLTVVDTLQTVTTEITTTVTDEKRRLNIPETVNEGFMSDASDDEADENMVGGGFLTNNEMRELGDDSIVPTEASMFAISKDSRYSTLGSTPVHHNGFGADRRSSWSSSASDVDNIKPARIPRHSGFLVSFMVDARGGAMRSTRNPEMRILVPPKACRAPTRVTCRLARRRPLPGRTSTSPSLYDSEGKASRVVEVGPKGTGFLEPVAIEIPHFAYVKENYRELVVMRSNDGETWKIHESPCTDLEFREQFKEEDLESVDDLAAKRVFRVITKDFPRFFAVVSRPLENSKNIGTDGSELASTVIKDAKVKFPEGSLTKKISVSIQVLLISSDVCRRAVGGKAKASAILTIEPRRRKFHKPITLTIPLPVDTDMKDYLSSTEDSTLRLLCSISGGSDPAQWEDITGSTPLNFLDNCVTFTSTVSARFWLIDCRQPSESSKLAHEIYKEATRVPYMAKFVVFAKSHDPLEGKLRIFCLTEERYEKTLENQENFTEVARSKDIEVTEGCTLLVECSGNLNVPFKSSAQQKYPFNAFSENRVQFLAKVRDSTQDPCGRLTFYRVPNGPPKTHGPRRTLCNLNVKLPPCDRAGEAGSLEQEAVEARRRYYLVDPDSVHFHGKAESSPEEIARDMVDVLEKLQQVRGILEPLPDVEQIYKVPQNSQDPLFDASVGVKETKKVVQEVKDRLEEVKEILEVSAEDEKDAKDSSSRLANVHPVSEGKAQKIHSNNSIKNAEELDHYSDIFERNVEMTLSGVSAHSENQTTQDVHEKSRSKKDDVAQITKDLGALSAEIDQAMHNRDELSTEFEINVEAVKSETLADFTPTSPGVPFVEEKDILKQAYYSDVNPGISIEDSSQQDLVEFLSSNLDASCLLDQTADANIAHTKKACKEDLIESKVVDHVDEAIKEIAADSELAKLLADDLDLISKKDRNGKLRENENIMQVDEVVEMKRTIISESSFETPIVSCSSRSRSVSTDQLKSVRFHENVTVIDDASTQAIHAIGKEGRLFSPPDNDFHSDESESETASTSFSPQSSDLEDSDFPEEQPQEKPQSLKQRIKAYEAATTELHNEVENFRRLTSPQSPDVNPPQEVKFQSSGATSSPKRSPGKLPIFELFSCKHLSHQIEEKQQTHIESKSLCDEEEQEVETKEPSPVVVEETHSVRELLKKWNQGPSSSQLPVAPHTGFSPKKKRNVSQQDMPEQEKILEVKRNNLANECSNLESTTTKRTVAEPKEANHSVQIMQDKWKPDFVASTAAPLTQMAAGSKDEGHESAILKTGSNLYKDESSISQYFPLHHLLDESSIETKQEANAGPLVKETEHTGREETLSVKKVPDCANRQGLTNEEIDFANKVSLTESHSDENSERSLSQTMNLKGNNICKTGDMLQFEVHDANFVDVKKEGTLLTNQDFDVKADEEGITAQEDKPSLVGPSIPQETLTIVESVEEVEKFSKTLESDLLLREEATPLDVQNQLFYVKSENMQASPITNKEDTEDMSHKNSNCDLECTHEQTYIASNLDEGKLLLHTSSETTVTSVAVVNLQNQDMSVSHHEISSSPSKYMEEKDSNLSKAASLGDDEISKSYVTSSTELLEMDSPITDCISPQELDEVMSDDIKAEKLIYASHVGKALVGDSFYVDRPTMESIRDSVKAESFSLAGNMNVDKNESEKPVKTELVCDSENETKTNALTEEINCSPGTTVVLVKTNVTSYTDVVESQELDDFEAFEQRFCMDTSAKDTVVKSCAFVKKESTEGNSDNKCDVLPINNVLGQEESKNSEKHEENISSINTHVAISVSETELQDVFNDPISNQTKINDERDSLSSTDLMDSRPRNLSGVSELSKPTTTCAAFTDFNIQDESVKSNNLQTETRSKHLRMTNSDSPIDAESSLITENKMDVNKTETLRSVTTEIVSDSEKITEATTLTKETYDCPVNTVVSVKTNAPSYSDGIEPQQLHDFERLEQRFCMDYSANGTEASLLPTVVVKSPTHVEKDFPEHCRDDNSHVTHADDVLEQTITSTIPEENKVVYKHEDVGKGLESEDRTLHENQDLPSAQGEVLNEENEAVIEIEVDKHDIFKKDEEEESSINSCVVLSASQFDVRKIFADPISDETEMTEKHDRLSVLDVADSRPKVLSDITELSQPTATCATSMVVTRLDESPKSDVLGSEKGSKLSMIPSRDSRVEAECSSFTGNKININKTETQTSVKDEIFYDSENDSKANEPTEETNDSPVMAIASVKTDAPSYTDVIKRQELNDFETLEQRICINPSANATGVSLISTVVVKSPTFAEEGSTESYSDNKYDTTHGDGVLKQVSNSFVFEENDVTDKLEYSDKELVPEEGKLQKNRDEVLCKEKDALLEVGAEEDDILEENEEERSSVNFHVSISASQTDEQDFFDDLVSDETEMSEEHDSFSAMDHTNSRPRFLSDISELSEPTTTCARSIVFTTLDESPKSDILEDEIGSELSTTPSSDIGIEAEISLGLTETEDINKTETPVKEEIVCDSKNETKTKALTKGTNVMVTNIVSVKTDATSNTNVLETHEVDDFEALEQRFCIGYSAKATEASLIPTVVVKSPSLAEEDSTKCYSDDLPVADVFAQVITSPIFEENDVTENLKSVDEELALEEEKLQEKLSSPSLQGEVLGEEKDALFKIGAEESTFSEEVQEEKSSINTHVAISASHTDLGDFFNDPTSDKTKMNAECDSSSALDVIDGRSRALSDISELSELTRTSATSTVSTTQDETSESDTLESEKRSELSKTPCSDSPVEAESFSWTENMKINKTETEKPVKENIVSDSENEIKTIALTEETNEPSQSIVSVKTDVPSYTDVLETQELHDFETLEQRFCMDFSANGSGASLIPTVVVKSPTCAEEDSAERYSDNNYDVTHIDDILDQVITSPILKENDVTEKLEYVDKKGKLFENPNSRSVQGEVLCEEKDALSEDGSEEDEILEEDKEERSSVNFHVSISASQIDVRNFFDNPISNETKMSEEYDSVSALDVVDSRPRALSDISELSEPTATCATSMVITTRDEYPKSDIMGSENGIQVSTTPQSLDETKDIMFLPDEAAAKEATVKSDEANYMYPHVTNMVCINEQTGKRVNETVYEAETNEKIVETLCSVVVDVDGGEEQSDSIILLGDQLTFDESYQKPHVIPNETESNQQPKDSVQILSEANCSNTVAHTPDTPPKAEQISLVSPSSCSDEWRHTIDSLPNSKVVDKKFVEEDSASTTLGLVQENGAISKHEVQEYEKSESEPTDFETSENTFAVPDSYQMVTMSSPKLVKPRKQLANITQTWISQESDITVGRSSDEESEIHRLDNIDEVLSDAENKQETSPEEQVTQFETDSEVIDKSFKLEDHSSTPPDASEPNKDDFVSTTDDVNDVAEVQIGQIRTTSGMIVMSDATDGEKNRRIVGEGITMLERNRLSFDSVTQDTDRRLSLLSCTSSTCSVHSSDAPDIEPTLGGIIPYQTKEEVTYKPRNDQDGLSKMGKNSVSLDDDFAYSSLDVIENVSKGLDKENEDKVSVQKATQIVNEVVQSASVRATVSDAPQEAEKKDNLGETDHDLSKGIMGSLDATVIRDNEKQGIRDDVKLEETIHSMSSQISAAALHSALSAEASPIDQSDIFKDSDLKANKLKPVSENVEDVSPSRPDSIFKTIEANVEECIVQTTTTSEAALFGQGWSTIGNVTTTTTTDGVSDSPKNDKAPFTPEKKSELISATMEKNLNIDTEPLPERNACHSLSDWLNEDYTKQPAKKDTAFKTIAAQEESCVTVTDQPYELHGVEHVTAECDENYPNLQRYENPQTIAPSRFIQKDDEDCHQSPAFFTDLESTIELDGAENDKRRDKQMSSKMEEKVLTLSTDQKQKAFQASYMSHPLQLLQEEEDKNDSTVDVSESESQENLHSHYSFIDQKELNLLYATESDEDDEEDDELMSPIDVRAGELEMDVGIAQGTLAQELADAMGSAQEVDYLHGQYFTTFQEQEHEVDCVEDKSSIIAFRQSSDNIMVVSPASNNSLCISDVAYEAETTPHLEETPTRDEFARNENESDSLSQVWQNAVAASHSSSTDRLQEETLASIKESAASEIQGDLTDSPEVPAQADDLFEEKQSGSSLDVNQEYHHWETHVSGDQHTNVTECSVIQGEDLPHEPCPVDDASVDQASGGENLMNTQDEITAMYSKSFALYETTTCNTSTSDISASHNEVEEQTIPQVDKVKEGNFKESISVKSPMIPGDSSNKEYLSEDSERDSDEDHENFCSPYLLGIGRIVVSDSTEPLVSSDTNVKVSYASNAHTTSGFCADSTGSLVVDNTPTKDDFLDTVQKNVLIHFDQKSSNLQSSCPASSNDFLSSFAEERVMTFHEDSSATPLEDTGTQNNPPISESNARDVFLSSRNGLAVSEQQTTTQSISVMEYVVRCQKRVDPDVLSDSEVILNHGELSSFNNSNTQKLARFTDNNLDVEESIQRPNSPIPPHLHESDEELKLPCSFSPGFQPKPKENGKAESEQACVSGQILTQESYESLHTPWTGDSVGDTSAGDEFSFHRFPPRQDVPLSVDSAATSFQFSTSEVFTSEDFYASTRLSSIQDEGKILDGCQVNEQSHLSQISGETESTSTDAKTVKSNNQDEIASPVSDSHIVLETELPKSPPEGYMSFVSSSAKVGDAEVAFIPKANYHELSKNASNTAKTLSFEVEFNAGSDVMQAEETESSAAVTTSHQTEGSFSDKFFKFVETIESSRTTSETTSHVEKSECYMEVMDSNTARAQAARFEELSYMSMAYEQATQEAYFRQRKDELSSTESGKDFIEATKSEPIFSDDPESSECVETENLDASNLAFLETILSCEDQGKAHELNENAKAIIDDAPLESTGTPMKESVRDGPAIHSVTKTSKIPVSKVDSIIKKRSRLVKGGTKSKSMETTYSKSLPTRGKQKSLSRSLTTHGQTIQSKQIKASSSSKLPVRQLSEHTSKVKVKIPPRKDSKGKAQGAARSPNSSSSTFSRSSSGGSLKSMKSQKSGTTSPVQESIFRSEVFTNPPPKSDKYIALKEGVFTYKTSPAEEKEKRERSRTETSIGETADALTPERSSGIPKLSKGNHQHHRSHSSSAEHSPNGNRLSSENPFLEDGSGFLRSSPETSSTSNLVKPSRYQLSSGIPIRKRTSEMASFTNDSLDKKSVFAEAKDEATIIPDSLDKDLIYVETASFEIPPDSLTGYQDSLNEAGENDISSALSSDSLDYSCASVIREIEVEAERLSITPDSIDSNPAEAEFILQHSSSDSLEEFAAASRIAHGSLIDFDSLEEFPQHLYAKSSNSNDSLNDGKSVIFHTEPQAYFPDSTGFQNLQTVESLQYQSTILQYTSNISPNVSNPKQRVLPAKVVMKIANIDPSVSLEPRCSTITTTEGKPLNKQHEAVASQLGIQWPQLAVALGLTPDDVWKVQKQNSGRSPGEQSKAMMRMWINARGDEATDSTLGDALREINRKDLVALLEDPVFHFEDNIEPSIHMDKHDATAFGALSHELGSPFPTPGHVSSPYPFPPKGKQQKLSTSTPATKAYNELAHDDVDGSVLSAPNTGIEDEDDLDKPHFIYVHEEDEEESKDDKDDEAVHVKRDDVEEKVRSRSHSSISSASSSDVEKTKTDTTADVFVEDSSQVSNVGMQEISVTEKKSDAKARRRSSSSDDEEKEPALDEDAITASDEEESKTAKGQESTSSSEDEKEEEESSPVNVKEEKAASENENSPDDTEPAKPNVDEKKYEYNEQINTTTITRTIVIETNEPNEVSLPAPKVEVSPEGNHVIEVSREVKQTVVGNGVTGSSSESSSEGE
ncbi:unnamed protein product [Clavelina lepadiformis]|uniref:Ankyrin-3 n=1 Tax=Clavelina lepadiformis TaxID=159417 RepID=A0ABP0GKC1_CLALP